MKAQLSQAATAAHNTGVLGITAQREASCALRRPKSKYACDPYQNDGTAYTIKALRIYPKTSETSQMANYEADLNGTHAGHAFWGLQPPTQFVPTMTIPNPQHNGLHPVGGGVPPHTHAMTQHTPDRSELQYLLSTKAHLEMEIGGLQQRLDTMNVRIQALRARHEQLDH